MDLPVSETPLYNHTLPQIEQWLKEQGCKQDKKELEHWRLKKQPGKLKFGWTSSKLQ